MVYTKHYQVFTVSRETMKLPGSRNTSEREETAMIFTSGLVSQDVVCPTCKAVHFNVQFGEEAVVCRCGGVLTTKVVNSKEVHAIWISQVDAAEWVGRGIHDDKRNLC